jgi:hypothetical protein
VAGWSACAAFCACTNAQPLQHIVPCFKDQDARAVSCRVLTIPRDLSLAVLATLLSSMILRNLYRTVCHICIFACERAPVELRPTPSAAVDGCPTGIVTSLRPMS